MTSIHMVYRAAAEAAAAAQMLCFQSLCQTRFLENINSAEFIIQREQ